MTPYSAVYRTVSDSTVHSSYTCCYAAPRHMCCGGPLMSEDTRSNVTIGAVDRGKLDGPRLRHSTPPSPSAAEVAVEIRASEFHALFMWPTPVGAGQIIRVCASYSPFSRAQDSVKFGHALRSSSPRALPLRFRSLDQHGDTVDLSTGCRRGRGTRDPPQGPRA